MPTARFIVTVSVRESVGKTYSTPICVADAVKYLAYGDQTDLFGYHSAIKSVSSLEAIGERAYESVEIEFVAPVANSADIKDFIQECETLARVTDAECVSNPVDPQI